MWGREGGAYCGEGGGGGGWGQIWGGGALNVGEGGRRKQGPQ